MTLPFPIQYQTTTQGQATIGIGSDKVFQVQLLNNGAPFDLTNMSNIEASFPAPNLKSIVETFLGGNVSVVGAPGAGRIQITTPGVDTLGMLANPFPPQFQDLQIIVTLSGVAQIDSLSIGSSIVAGHTYSITLNGTVFSYIATNTDTDFSVFTALLNLILAVTGPFPISAVLTGSPGTALLTLTSTLPGLAFSDVVSSNITKVLTRANAGTRSQFLLIGALNIVPQPYPLA